MGSPRAQPANLTSSLPDIVCECVCVCLPNDHKFNLRHRRNSDLAYDDIVLCKPTPKPQTLALSVANDMHLLTRPLA